MSQVPDPERWLADNGIAGVTLIGSNHDGVALGKHLSPAKFLSALEQGSTLADTSFGLDVAGDVALGWDWGRWRGEVADVALLPDARTLRRDPSRQGWATAICDFTGPGGEPVPVCFRSTLKRLVAELDGLGYRAVVSPEIELIAFEQPIEEVRARGYRGLTPLGGPVRVTYVISRSPDLSELMDAGVARLAELGIGWECWSAETAPGQAEINLAPADPVATADAIVRTKLAMREVAAELGRSVSFIAYGIDEALGSGMHLNLSLSRDGANAFFDPSAEGNRSELMRRWLAGMLATMPGAQSFLSPSVNSYRRLIDITGPPTSVTWGEDNKSVALRTVSREPGSSRIEHRLAASDCNPYAALAALLAGGLAGMEEDLEPPPPFEGMAWALPEGTVEMLPDSIRGAAAALRGDERLRRKLGAEAVDYWLGTREWEWIAFHAQGGDPDEVNEAELRRYFEQP